MEQTCNDTQELYEDLQTYNPYTEEMVQKINNAIIEQTQFLENLGNE